MTDQMSLDVEKTDDKVFNELVCSYQAMLTAVAYRILRDKSLAEDVVQETLLKLYYNLESLDEEIIASWLYRVCSNQAIQVFRKRKRKDEIMDKIQDSAGGEVDTPLDSLEKEEDAKKVWKAVCALPPKQHIVLVMRHYEGRSMAEIAQYTESAIGTVKANLHSALKNLKNLL